jgi:hypothetical protein
MYEFSKLPVNITPETYALVQVKNQTKLACLVQGEWIIDATCKSINEMLEMGIVSKESVTGWINIQTNKGPH